MKENSHENMINLMIKIFSIIIFIMGCHKSASDPKEPPYICVVHYYCNLNWLCSSIDCYTDLTDEFCTSFEDEIVDGYNQVIKYNNDQTCHEYCEDYNSQTWTQINCEIK